jgi:Fur family iron response transcriptional regulator
MADATGRSSEQKETRAARAERWLAGSALRPTRQRLALAELLVGDGRDRHVTAEELYETAKAAGEKVSLATVYNTLRSFTEAGLMAEISVDGTRSYYDTNVSNHAHYFWEEDGHLSDAPADAISIERVAEPPEGAEIAKLDIVIRLRRR